MTTTVPEADELIALAEQRDLRIVASPGEVLLPQVTRTRELIEDGAIGELSWAMCGVRFGDTTRRRAGTKDARVEPRSIPSGTSGSRAAVRCTT